MAGAFECVSRWRQLRAEALWKPGVRVYWPSVNGGGDVEVYRGADREQAPLIPKRLEDWIVEDHPVRVIDAFVDALNLPSGGFDRTAPAQTGRSGYHPSALLKLFIHG